MNLTRRQLAAAVAIAPVVLFAVPMATVTPQHSEAALKAFLSQRHVHLASATLLELVQSMIAFYTDVRATALRKGENSDMLLFQWGVYDWGEGAHFEFDITRQFIGSSGTDEGAISQLRLTAYIFPSPALREVPSGNRWCESVEGVAEFRAYILSSAAYQLASSEPKRVKVLWSPV